MRQCAQVPAATANKRRTPLLLCLSTVVTCVSEKAEGPIGAAFVSAVVILVVGGRAGGVAGSGGKRLDVHLKRSPGAAVPRTELAHDVQDGRPRPLGVVQVCQRIGQPRA